jgi:hypothetical protein
MEEREGWSWKNRREKAERIKVKNRLKYAI